MAKFELTGPDGARYEITAENEGAALAAFSSFSSGGEAEKKPSKVGLTDVVRSTATGVPIVGGLANKLNAATAAVLAPVVEPLMGDSPDNINDAPGETVLDRLGNRFSKALDIQNKRDEKFAAEHPIVDTAAKLTGGVGGSIPMVMAAPAAFGLTGTIGQQVARGAASNAALSAADAAVRGEDVVVPGAVGAFVGAGAPFAGKAIGAVGRAIKGAPAPVASHSVKVGGVEVPMTPAEMSGDVAGHQAQQIALRGGSGDKAQGIAQSFEEARAAKLGEASDEIARTLDPAAGPATTPQAAGARVVDELVDQEATRRATDAARAQRAALEGDQLRASVGGNTLPAGLHFDARPSSELRPGPGTPANAHEIQILGADGTPHYRMEITQEGGGNWGVGYVENLTREHSGLAGRLYEEAAKYANDRGGRLLAGMNANRGSSRVLSDLERAGIARPVEVGGRQLFEIGQRPAVDSALGAGEAVGAGVTAARNTAKRQVTANYDARNAVEGTFDPAVARTMAEEIRARANAGPPADRLWIDPQTTSKANEALKIIDQTIGGQSGLFHNVAAPTPKAVGPVAEAIARAEAPAAPTEASRALDELLAQGVNPERARAAVAKMPGGDAIPPGILAPHEVAVPGGASVQVKPKVVEASALKASGDAGYDASLQPRNRARAASDVQVQDIAKNLNPARLGVSTEADRGAPIIGSDGMVESGNGRVMALRRAYQENGSSAQRYREWLQSQGVDVSKFKEPVLVRERTTAMSPAERKAFTVGANQSSTLSLSASERALADARALTPENLSLIRNPADLGAADNRDFVRAFMQTVPQAERGALMTANGELSAEGLTRVRNAVLGKAYGDTPILARIAESTNDEVKGISNALTAAAPEWASLRAAVADGRVPGGLDITPDLIDAVQRTARLRAKGTSLEASQAQADAFGTQSDASKALQRFFYEADGAKAAPSSKVADSLRNYAQQAAKVDAAPGLDLGLAPVTARDILESTAKKMGAPAELAKEVLAAAEAKAAPAAAEALAPIGVVEMDAARKRLNVLLGDAKATALRTGDWSDHRAIRRIIDEFDNVVMEAHAAGRFSGDSELAQQLDKTARASHSQFRQTFTSRGAGDEIGRDVEKIIGRFSDTAMTPDQVAKLSYGSLTDPGGGKATKIAQRLRSILGETSPEWGAYKQGLLEVLDDRALSATKRADRIEKYLTGTTGRVHAQVVLSADERAALGRYAENLRASEPRSLDGPIDKVIASISGAETGMPWTADMLSDALLKHTGKGAKIVAVAQRLKRDLSPDGFNQMRVGMWKKLTESTGERADFGPQKMVSRVGDFLETDMAKVLYSPQERALMSTYVKAHKQMIAPPNATNPSGTAGTLAKIARSASSNLLAMLGAAHSGFVGLAVGHGADKAAKAIGNAREGRAALRTFYGDQPKAAIKSSRVPIILAPAISQQASGRR